MGKLTTLAKRRSYWLRRLMHEHGWRAADLARHAKMAPRAGGQLLREWAATGSQPRDGTLAAVSSALSVCPSIFHTPIPAGEE